MDPTERELTGLDIERPLPTALRDRLETALRRDASTRAVADDTAALLDDLDRPLLLPVSMRRALEQQLIASPRRNRWRTQVAAAVAAAVLLVLAAVAATNNGRDDVVAVGPARTTTPDPVGAVPAPTPTEAVAAGRAAAASTVPTSTPCRAACGPTAGAAAAGGRAEAAAPSAAMSEPGASQVSSVDPASGPMSGGTTVTVKGTGFTGATGMRFGTSAAVGFKVVSDGEIQALSPPASEPGAVSVVVTLPDGGETQAGPAAQFTYTAAGP